MIANLPFVKSLFEKFSEKDVGADIEVTSFSGVLTVNQFCLLFRFSKMNFTVFPLAQHSSTTK